MKYLKSFGGLIKESNRFLHFKEVLDTIEDLSLDFKDDGGETIFGNIPSVGANFDENLDDIFIKMASLGKKSVYVKFDIQNIKKSSDGRLSEESLELLIDTINSVYNYLLGEGMVVQNFWAKELVARKRSDYGKNEFFSYKTIDELINSIDFVRTEKLDQMVSSTGIKMKKDDIIFRSLLDVRIVFSGHPILEESKDFRVELQANESDYESLKEIIDDFNQNNIEGDDKDFEATIHSKLFGRPVRANFGTNKLNCKAYLVMIDDRSKSYNGFQISDVSDLILRFMSELGSESIMSRIVFIGDPMRENFTLTKDDLLNNKPMDPISNLSFYIEIVP